MKNIDIGTILIAKKDFWCDGDSGLDNRSLSKGNSYKIIRLLDVRYEKEILIINDKNEEHFFSMGYVKKLFMDLKGERKKKLEKIRNYEG